VGQHKRPGGAIVVFVTLSNYTSFVSVSYRSLLKTWCALRYVVAMYRHFKSTENIIFSVVDRSNMLLLTQVG